MIFTKKWRWLLLLTIPLSAMVLFGQEKPAERDSSPSRPAFDLHGFLDLRGGLRTAEDATQRDTSLAESRLQLESGRRTGQVTWLVRADLIYDRVVEQTHIDLEQGRGWLDLREANALFSPTSAVDIKAGRQIMTWGTGDLLFINDLFPKDWQSFFTGRDEEYLKAPSDAVLISWFPRLANIDVVYTPRFDADRYLRGERLSYWNNTLGRRAGRDAVIDAMVPDQWLDDDEISLRISRTIGSFELAFYGYDGFWKSPAGGDPETGRAVFPRLRTFGLSARGNLGKGVISLEAGMLDSLEDRAGENPLTANGETRLLIGYEQEIGGELTFAGQAYWEHLADYAAYRHALAEGIRPRDRDRLLITIRLTQLAMNQNMTLSLFGFYSPTDEDYYLRPKLGYKASDAWLWTLGANLFGGNQPSSFFGQFEDNSNLYAGLKYSF